MGMQDFDFHVNCSRLHRGPPRTVVASDTPSVSEWAPPLLTIASLQTTVLPRHLATFRDYIWLLFMIPNNNDVEVEREGLTMRPDKRLVPTLNCWPDFRRDYRDTD